MAKQDAEIEALAGADNQAFEGTATAGMTLMVSLQAHRGNRYVEAEGYINGRLVCAASAADNHLAGVISTPKQSFTLPVPPGARWLIRWNIPNNNGEVRITRLPV